jgi:hypothetical protein
MAELTDKQKRFCEEYLEHNNYSLAETRSDYSLYLKGGAKYFVYFLINPNDQSIFYVGKGKGKRPNNHLSEAKNNRTINVFKNKIIKDILATNKKPEIKFFAIDLEEETAFKIERLLIENIGKGNLTNIANGFNVQSQSDIAKYHLSRMIPFERWVKEKNPSESHKDMYWKVKSNFEQLAYKSPVNNRRKQDLKYGKV